MASLRAISQSTLSSNLNIVPEACARFGQQLETPFPLLTCRSAASGTRLTLIYFALPKLIHYFIRTDLGMDRSTEINIILYNFLEIFPCWEKRYVQFVFCFFLIYVEGTLFLSCN